jgi:diguanylate cyclase (GGDEF)-like protein
MKVMKDHLTGKLGVYEVEYRIKAKNGCYKWYHDIGKITQYDQDGKPVLVAGIVFDITQKKELQYELECKNKILCELSELDGLTKLYNHRMIMEHLQNAIDQTEKNKKIFSIIILDIDDFKKINDTRGHLFGDKVLTRISSIIRNSIEKTDIAGRYGGEEFLIIFTEDDIEQALKYAEKIRKSIEECCIDGAKVTISGGIQGYDGSNKDNLIRSADKKLYDAKKSGKNRIIY